MIDDPQRTRMVTQPLATRPSLLTPRPAWWGCGGLAVGAAIGALLMLLALIAFAPRPQAAAPGAGGQDGNLVINMDDTYLTTQVSAAISQAKLPIALSNIRAEILPGDQVKISADTDSALPLGAHLEAVAQVRIESGQLAMHLISAQVGGLPLPAAITSALERPMNERMQKVSAVLLPSGYIMTAISSTEHHLLMTISNHPG